MPDSDLLLGLDAGGSKTLLYGRGPDAPDRFERRGPGANPTRVGLSQSADTLAALVADAAAAHPSADRLVLCAGVAGAGDDATQAALTDALTATLARPNRAAHVEVVHDGLIALEAAYGDGSGAIVVAGTGSLVLARTHDGTIVRAGGWGPTLGDDGSGHALGRAGLRAVAEALDGGRPTALRDEVRTAFDIDDRAALLRFVHGDSAALPDVAPIVVDTAETGDPVATRILRDQVSALARQLDWLRARAADVAPRLALLGGLTTNDHYRRALREALHDRVPDWSVRRLDIPPALGALRRARRRASTL
jgi:N-acetylglucosamine kinase-like BadF-type ATPase